MQVSVIIPTIKPKAYLWEALDSLVKQILDPTLFEIIVVLNGPQDRYLTEISDYIAMVDSRPEATPSIRLLYTEEAGVSNARNKGLEVAKGSYVAFIDDDDWVSATYLADLLAAAGYANLPYELSAKNKGPMVASFVLNFENDRYCDDYITRAYRRCAGYKRITLMNGRSLLSSACCKLIPRGVIGDTRFETTLTHGEDALFVAMISHRISEIRLANPDAIYYRRVHSDSAKFRKRSFWKRLKNTSFLCWYYLILLLQPWRYKTKFIVSRIVATLKRFA